jgi:hypothetical protein
MATTTYNPPAPSAPQLNPNDPDDFPAFAQAFPSLYQASAPPLSAPPQAFSRLAPPPNPIFYPPPSAPPPSALPPNPAFSRSPQASAPPPSQSFEPSPAPNSINPPFSRSASSPSFNLENFKNNLDSFSLALFENQFKFILDQQKKQMNALENKKCNKDCQDANNTTEKNTVNQFISENTNTIFNK